jgi:hypothetical protein
LELLDVSVAIVTFEGGPRVDTYARETGFDWPILVDESLELYSAYGMGHGHWWHIWGPPAWWIYFKLLIRGRRPHMPSANVNQLGGDVLIDPEGTIRLQHVGKGPADRPPVNSLLAVVEGGS